MPIATVRDKPAAAVVNWAPELGTRAVDKPVAEKPVVEKPPVQVPVVEEPVRHNPVLDEFPIDEFATTERVLPAPPAAEPVTPPAVEPIAPSPTVEFTSDLFGSLVRGQQPAHATESPHPHPIAPPTSADVVLSIQRLRKTYGATVAVDAVSLDVRAGSFYGIVGPNGAGKTTTLSIITGLLRPDAGVVWVHGIDVWRHPAQAKRSIGVLPDRLRLFDRLTGAQFLRYAGTLRGLDAGVVRERAADLAAAFGLEDALGRLVADYSAGMTKKVALAAAMIHSPRLLILDEPFESVDPVSAANVIEILQKYVAAGGTVVLSSHGMDLIQRVCDSVAIIVNGKVLASGTVDEVRGGRSLEDRFVELAGGRKAAEGLEWLHSFSD